MQRGLDAEQRYSFLRKENCRENLGYSIANTYFSFPQKQI